MNKEQQSLYLKRKKRIYDIIEIGNKDDFISKSFDIFIVIVIFINLFLTLFDTFDVSKNYKGIISVVELITIIIFTIEYILRLWTANVRFPNKGIIGSRIAFIFTFFGLIDLFTFLPYYFPLFFAQGAVAFRIFRVIRIFRLFRINAQYDAFNVIINVLKERRSQLVSSLVMISILIIASSLFMYSLEHEAQPEIFSNALSGIWWSVSTLLTVGYGDIVPITIAGKIMAIIIAFLGVLMVAIPTGIISAGFVEHYTKLNKVAFLAEEKDIPFITSNVSIDHDWANKKLVDIVMPPDLLLLLILRDNQEYIPNKNVTILPNDTLIFAGKNFNFSNESRLNEIKVKGDHPWIDDRIADLDISRQDYIVLIKRKNKFIIPSEELIIKRDDVVLMYSKQRIDRKKTVYKNVLG